MRSARWLRPILLVLVACGVTQAAEKADMKVAVWYRRDRPLETFRYQVYDMRKGEYTRAVDDWIGLLRTRFPAYEVHVRDIVLAREKGANDLQRLGSVLQRELLVAAALEGVVIGEPAPRVRAPRLVLPDRPSLPGGTAPGAVDLNPPRASFPVPYPYPRPHP